MYFGTNSHGIQFLLREDYVCLYNIFPDLFLPFLMFFIADFLHTGSEMFCMLWTLSDIEYYN